MLFCPKIIPRVFKSQIVSLLFKCTRKTFELLQIDDVSCPVRVGQCGSKVKKFLSSLIFSFRWIQSKAVVLSCGVYWLRLNHYFKLCEWKQQYLEFSGIKHSLWVHRGQETEQRFKGLTFSRVTVYVAVWSQLSVWQ